MPDRLAAAMPCVGRLADPGLTCFKNLFQNWRPKQRGSAIITVRTLLSVARLEKGPGGGARVNHRGLFHSAHLRSRADLQRHELSAKCGFSLVLLLKKG